MYLTTKQLQDLLHCCRSTAEKIGTDAGAKIRVGRMVRWDLDKIRTYMQSKEVSR